MHPGTLRTIAIVSALAAGSLVPAAASAAFLIPWLVAAMLFVVFLGTSLRAARIRRIHVHLLGANVAIATAAYGTGWALGNRDVALAGLFAGVAPTAAAAPVIVGLLGGSVEFVVAAFLLSNTAIALLLAVALPWLLGSGAAADFRPIATSIGLIVFAPMLAAYLVRRVHPAAATWPRSLTNASFATWVTVLFLITAKASHFLRTTNTGSTATLTTIAVLSAATCAAGFILGRWIGGPEFAREASQSLGQKNTTFTIYLALAHASPLVALGPTFYVLWHNLWNAWNLHQAHRAAQRPQAAPADPDTPAT